MFQINCLCDFDFLNIKNDYIKSDKGAIIYANYDGRCFPDDEWFDLPIDVVLIWMNHIKKSYEMKYPEFKLIFMDGPFYIQCYRKKTKVKMQFVHEEYEEKIRYNKIKFVTKKNIIEEFEIDFEELAKSIYKVGCEIVKSFEDHNINEIEDDLKNPLKKLKIVLGN